MTVSSTYWNGDTGNGGQIATILVEPAGWLAASGRPEPEQPVEQRLGKDGVGNYDGPVG